MIMGRTPTFRLKKSSSHGKKFTVKIAYGIGLRDMKNQRVKQDAILKKKTSFEFGSGNAECGKREFFYLSSAI